MVLKFELFKFSTEKVLKKYNF